MIVYLFCYAASWLFAAAGFYLMSGISLMAAALWLYLEDYRKTGNLLHLRGLFSLFFVGGQGLACLKLSYLSTDWEAGTWFSFLAAYVGFYAVFAFLESGDSPERVRMHRSQGLDQFAEPVFFCAMGLTLLSFGCFLVEAAALGYVPLFVRGVPHAYSEFHLRGIHYLTVLCVLVPAISVIYFCIERGRSRGRMAVMLLLDAAALAVPLLCVSRFQLMMAILLAVLTYLEMEGRFNPLYVAAGLAGLGILYVLLTFARSHDAAYLNAVFEMKRDLPLVLTQPYTYVANNYDNFNCLVQQLPGHTFGTRMLAPLWTLTGLKFLFPSLTSSPIFVTKEELTTLTLFYDAYYDFGIPGVLLFSGLLGAAAFLLMQMMRQVRNPMSYLLYGQFALYLMLSFFTTWFSNTTTWFYLAVTAVMAFAVTRLFGRT